MVTTVLRIGAIVILINLLEQVPLSVENVYHSWKNELNISVILFSISPGIFALIISFLLWFFPSTLSSKFSPQNDDEYKNENVNYRYLGEILISILGLYMITKAIPDLVYHIVFFIMAHDENLSIPPIDRAAFVATIAELVIGTFLLYGSGLIHRMIQEFKKEVKT